MNKEIAKLKDEVRYLCKKVQQQEKVISFLSKHQYSDVVIRDQFFDGICVTYTVIEYLKGAKVISLCLSESTSASDYKLIRNNEEVAVFELEDQYCILNKEKEAFCLCHKDIFDINKITKSRKK